MTERRETDRPLLLFDGVCNLCHSSVNFVIDRDPDEVFDFASLQSEHAREVLAGFGVTPKIDTIYLVEGGRLYERSTAALRIARRLRGAWPLMAAFLIVPRPIRDGVYRFIANRRYRWFGKEEACRIPTPELQARFLG